MGLFYTLTWIRNITFIYSLLLVIYFYLDADYYIAVNATCQRQRVEANVIIEKWAGKTPGTVKYIFCSATFSATAFRIRQHLISSKNRGIAHMEPNKINSSNQWPDVNLMRCIPFLSGKKYVG